MPTTTHTGAEWTSTALRCGPLVTDHQGGAEIMTTTTADEFTIDRKADAIVARADAMGASLPLDQRNALRADVEAVVEELIDACREYYRSDAGRPMPSAEARS